MERSFVRLPLFDDWGTEKARMEKEKMQGTRERRAANPPELSTHKQRNNNNRHGASTIRSIHDQDTEVFIIRQL